MTTRTYKIGTFQVQTSFDVELDWTASIRVNERVIYGYGVTEKQAIDDVLVAVNRGEQYYD